MRRSNGCLRLGGCFLFLLGVVNGYTAGPPLNFTHVNCYSDSTSFQILDGPLANLKPNGNSPKNCAQACSNLGFPLAGVENGSICQCGNAINDTASGSSACTSRCSGDNTTTCGGPHSIDVYRIAFPALITRPTFDPPPFPSLPGKIILEEHASTTQFTAAFSYPFVNNTNEILFGKPAYMADVAARLNGSNATSLALKVADMDKANVSITIISLVPPGLQGVLDPDLAVQLAPKVNDEFSSIYGTGQFASRFRFFCSVALQDPSAAVTELKRCMGLPGAVGVFLAGYTNTGGNDTHANTLEYFDEDEFEPFWAAAEELGVPVYLHSRMPAPDQQQVYRGYEWLGGSVWGFSTDVAVEALRLMASGLFDRHPSLQIALGHLGEGIPFSLYRMDQRMRHFTKTWPMQKNLQYYWENNFLMTTSGVQDTNAFWNAMKTTTPDRMMFSADTPFETMPEMVGWFDDLEMNSKTKDAVSSGNARKWYKL